MNILLAAHFQIANAKISDVTDVIISSYEIEVISALSLV